MSATMLSTIKSYCALGSKSQRRLISSFAKKKDVPAPFPTSFHPVRSANKTKIQLPEGVVYNPPSSAPTPYQTPSAFLPAKDARRNAPWNQQNHDIGSMPPLATPTEKTYNLTKAEISEIQNLRLEDPEKWTRKALAKKFNCSPFFISMVSKPASERQVEMDRRLGIIQSGWTDHRANARKDRARRRNLWLRDA